GQRASAAAFAGDGGDDRNLNARHLAQIAGNGLRLAALFRAQSGIRSGSVDEGKNRAAKLFRHLHTAQRLAIALRIGLAEVAVHALLGVTPFLMTDHHYVFIVVTRHAAKDGGIVAEAAVAVNFTPIGEQAFHVVHG